MLFIEDVSFHLSYYSEMKVKMDDYMGEYHSESLLPYLLYLIQLVFKIAFY